MPNYPKYMGRPPGPLGSAPPEVERLLQLTITEGPASAASEKDVAKATEALRRFYRVLAAAGIEAGDAPATEPLAQDLDGPAAIEALHATATRANKAETEDERHRLALRLKEQGNAVGLLHQDPETWLRSAGRDELSDHQIIQRIDARIAARRAKNFAEADRLRAELEAAGIVIKDRPNGTTAWERS